MHVHIATAGQAVEPVIKAFNAIPGIDRVYILYSKVYGESALELESFFGKAMVPVVLRPINGFDFQNIVDNIYAIYQAEHGKGVEFSINITGGTNLMAAAACSCAFFVGAKIYYVLRDPEKTAAEQLVQIPTPRTLNLEKIKGKTAAILGFILEKSQRGEDVRSSDIGKAFDVDKQNSSYHLGVLEGEGLIERVTDPNDRRVKLVRLTSQGRLVASWLSE